MKSILRPFSCFAALTLCVVLCGCGDSGGPVANEDEVTQYLEEHPELKKDIDSEATVTATESAPRQTVAAP